MLIATLAVAGGGRQGRLSRAPHRGLSRPKPKSTLTFDETDMFAASMDNYLESNPPPELKETVMDDAPYLAETSDYLCKLCLHSAGLDLGG